jgi:hypothetical protein
MADKTIPFTVESTVQHYLVQIRDQIQDACNTRASPHQALELASEGSSVLSSSTGSYQDYSDRTPQSLTLYTFVRRGIEHNAQ